MREKMHFYFEQQQNKVSEMENARVAAVKVEAVVEQENNKLEQEKVSVVIEKKELVDTKVAKTIIRKQGKRAVKVVIEEKEECHAEVGKEAKTEWE